MQVRTVLVCKIIEPAAFLCDPAGWIELCEHVLHRAIPPCIVKVIKSIVQCPIIVTDRFHWMILNCVNMYLI